MKILYIYYITLTYMRHDEETFSQKGKNLSNVVSSPFALANGDEI